MGQPMSVMFFQLCVFIRMVFYSDNIKEKVLKKILLHDKSRVEENFRRIYATVLRRNRCQSPQGGSGDNVGLVRRRRRDPDFQDFFSCHSVVYQQVLCAKRIIF